MCQQRGGLLTVTDYASRPRRKHRLAEARISRTNVPASGTALPTVTLSITLARCPTVVVPGSREYTLTEAIDWSDVKPKKMGVKGGEAPRPNTNCCEGSPLAK